MTPSPALSQEALRGDAGIVTRKVALLVADGVDGIHVAALTEDLARRGAVCETVGPHRGTVAAAEDGARGFACWRRACRGCRTM